MHTPLFTLRMRPAVRRYLAGAAGFSKENLSKFLLIAALARAEDLRTRGWKRAAAQPQIKAPTSAQRRKAARLAAIRARQQCARNRKGKT